MLTDWFIGATIGVIALFDVYLLLSPHKTISRRMRKHGRHIVTLPWAWGVVGSHFWGPDGLEPVLGSYGASAGIMAGIGVCLGVLHWITAKYIKFPRWWPLLYLLVGIPCGIWFWPQ